jgi:hypothetical protein
MSVHDECSDMVVPDACPDAMRVVFASGKVLIKDKSAQSDRILISGVVKAAVLYVPEDGVGIKRLEIPITFAHIEECKGVTQDSMVCVKACVRNIETRLINSRKISVCAYIVFNISAFNERAADICSGITAPKEEGVQVQITPQSTELNIAVVEKNLSVTDELEMPNGYPSVCEILNVDTKIESDEIKVLSNKIIVRGTVDFSAMCLSANEPGFINWMAQMPFSQIIEVPGIDENCKVTTDFMVKNADFMLSPENNGRKAEGSASLIVFVIAQKEEKLQLATDVYSTEYDIVPQFTMFNSSGPMSQDVMKMEIKDVFSDELDARSIVACNIGMDNVNLSEEMPNTMESMAFAQILFYDGEGNLFLASKKIPIMITTDKTITQKDTMLSGNITGIAADVNGGGGINLSFMVEMMAMNQKTQGIGVISNAQLPAAKKARKNNKISVIIRSPDEKETLWDIAKGYSTTMADIMNANKLEANEIKAGQMLLIPFSR